MTEKLYLCDSYSFQCQASIIDLIDSGDTLDVGVSKTPFFPGGGGQPCDCGYINEFKVTASYEINEIVYHKINRNNVSFNIGDLVFIKVDDSVRLERMRAHSGEHVFSGIAHRLFNVENVGFHMDEDCVMTVDFDRYLDSSNIKQLEIEVNKAIMNNSEITARTFSLAEASEKEYRSKLVFTDDVRIVEIAGVDSCACCAPHVKSTGEIGCVKVLSSASHRSGVRIVLVCGLKALFEFEKRYSQILKISALLCSKYDEAVSAVSELIDSNKSLHYDLDRIKSEHLSYIASKVSKSEIIFEFFEGLSNDDLRIINNNLKGKFSIMSLLLSGSDEIGYSYCVMSERIKLDEFARDFNKNLSGSGGGRGIMIQGRIKARAADVIAFINEMKVEEYENA